jgi:GNAT superfamily N-acetyltransferase
MKPQLKIDRDTAAEAYSVQRDVASGPAHHLRVLEGRNAVRVIEARARRQRKAFVLFPMRLYSECPHFVPPLIADELAVLSPKKNPAFENAETRLFLACRDGEVLGRIAAILSYAANAKHGTRNLRFGWFDCVNDRLVAEALFDAVEDWGRYRGMDTLTGPMGFDEFDKAGMLIEGFDKLPTMATYYNHPYYNDLVVQCGFTKEIDSFEYLIPDIRATGFPPRLAALVDKLKARRNYRVLEFRTRKQMLTRAREVLDLIEETYWELYDCVPMTDKQKANYARKYFPFMRKELVKLAVNEQDEVIGFFIAMPSISCALRKTGGRLLPFGWFHLWNALRTKNKTLDCALAGVKKAYRGRGVDLLLAEEMFKSAAALGFEEAESNPELETNLRVRAEWKWFDHAVHKRRRIYTKRIASR